MNLYYSPSEFGLELLWEVDYADSYDFNKVVIWGSRSTGALYLGADSGCSCPSPFEDIARLDDVNSLQRIDLNQPTAAEQSIRSTIAEANTYSDVAASEREADVLSALDRCRSWTSGITLSIGGVAA